MEGLERLERAVAHTLSSVATKPEGAGAIPELAGWTAPLNRSCPWKKPCRLQRPLGRLRQAWPGPEPEPVPHIVEEDLEQVTLPGLSPTPVAPALSSAERDLHRHAGGACNLAGEPALEGVLNDLPDMVPLGQFADTYMLVEAGEELLLVDQHALHERIRYERLRHDEALWEASGAWSPFRSTSMHGPLNGSGPGENAWRPSASNLKSMRRDGTWWPRRVCWVTMRRPSSRPASGRGRGRRPARNR